MRGANRACALCHKFISAGDKAASSYPNFTVVVEHAKNVGEQFEFCSPRCNLSFALERMGNATAASTDGVPAGGQEAPKDTVSKGS